MILVVNLNLTVDRIMEIDSLVPGSVHRASRTDLQAGGKGVNVIRTLRTLGEPCELLGIVAGRTGQYIDMRLEQEGIPRSLVRASGDSRTSVILLESKNVVGRPSQTVINESGPEIHLDAVEQIIDLFSRRILDSKIAVLTGSVPPGFGDDVYKRLIDIANRAGKQSFLDAAGEPLKFGISAPPTIVKPNQFEAGVLCGCPISSVGEAAPVARQMLKMGAQVSAITLGKEGMVVASEKEAYWLSPPRIDARNAVGSGDATAGGFAAGRLRGLSLLENAKLAVACGTASAKHGFGRSSVDEIEQVRDEIRVVKL